MNDLIEKLRARTVPQWTHTTGFGSRMNGHKPDELCQAAAAEITRLHKAALKARQLLAHMPTPDGYYLTAMSVVTELDEAIGTKK